jgi:hypothetical protein
MVSKVSLRVDGPCYPVGMQTPVGVEVPAGQFLAVASGTPLRAAKVAPTEPIGQVVNVATGWYCF